MTHRGGLPDEVQRVLRAGNKIEAIKLLRELTGLGLAQAKAAVEAGRLPDGASRSQPPRAGSGLPARVQGLLRQGKKVEAIKDLRQANNLGLKEAHDEVEAYLEKHPDLVRMNARGGQRSLMIAVIVVVVAALIVLMVRQGS